VAGQDIYLITSPQFDKTTIDLGNGATFKIIVNNNSDKNIYVQSASWNGKPFHQSWFKHSDIKNGAVLELNMGKKPTSWGSEILPPSMSDD